MSLNVDIRAEADGDHRAVYDVEAAAFRAAVQADIVEALRCSADPQLSLVATLDGVIVGHIFFSPATLDAHPDEAAAQLSPVAVVPSHQGQGVGSGLIRDGLLRCRQFGWSLVFVLGDPRYYSRFGFSLAAPLGFTYGDPVADMGLQVIETAPEALAGKAGRVRFHPAFDLPESSQ